MEVNFADGEATGYATAAYARSLGEFGSPRYLPRSGGWILERPLKGVPYRDGMGPYPLFCCRNWAGLRGDLEELATDLVSISLVVDPFGNHDEKALQAYFVDKFILFKSHFVADTRLCPEDFVTKHHRYYARRALRVVEVDRLDEPVRFVEEWSTLYGNLIARHGLTGIKAFSRRAFAAQLAVPGAVMLRAKYQGETVGAHLWYLQRNVAYSHLAAASDRGYDLEVSYALYWFALQTLAADTRWINFGAGAGLTGAETDGLTRFKRGWTTETRHSYFCGRTFDRQRYTEALTARGLDDTDYFPAYRRGEFN